MSSDEDKLSATLFNDTNPESNPDHLMYEDVNTTSNMINAPHNAPLVVNIDEFSPPTLRSTDLDYRTPPLPQPSSFDNMSSQSQHGITVTIPTDSLELRTVENFPTPMSSNTNTNFNRFSQFGNNRSPISPSPDFVNISPTPLSSSNILTNHNFSAIKYNKVRSKKSSPSVEKRYLSEFQRPNLLVDTGVENANPDLKVINEDHISEEFERSKPVSSALSHPYHKKSIDRVVSLPVRRTKDVDLERSSENIEAPPISVPKPEEILNHDNLGSVITYEVKTKEKKIWELSKEIGSGSFSKVYLTMDSRYVIKVTDINFNNFMSNSDDATNDGDLRLRIQNSLTRELQILTLLNHPNIIKLFGSNIKNVDSMTINAEEEDADEKSNQSSEFPLLLNRVSMVLEYCGGGTLFKFVKESRDLMSYDLIQRIFANIVSGISYMHDLGIVHRDIKLENVLLKFNTSELLEKFDSLKEFPIAVISDFGLSKKINPKNPLLSTRCGSEDYVSPELLLGMKYDGKQNDCWSLGVLLYAMLENRLPFDPLPNEKNSKTKRNLKPSHRIASISWSWFTMRDQKLSSEFRQAKDVTQLLLAKRTRRADIATVKNHPYCEAYVI